MSENATQPIIIKKVGKHAHEHHGGAWKVAYADMVTALMALFIVLWILGQDDTTVGYVAGYFQNPAGFLGSAASASPTGGAVANDMNVDDRERPPPPPPAKEEIDPEQAPGSGEGRSADRRLLEAAEAIRDALRSTPSYSKYRDQIELSVTPEGLRISLTESSDTPLFQAGDTELRGDARKLFRALGEQLARLPNHIAIEGHTDARPAANEAAGGNWELSTERAHAARRALVEGGTHTERVVQVVGYADRQLYNPLDPADSRNRRVSVTLLSEEAVRAREKLAQEKLLR